VNTATFDDFKKHPYLSYKQMNAIIKYRTQHGEYRDIKDLRAIALLNDDLLNRIAPYLSFSSK
jgi:DNA uptake protein ComE-like DNA-binding protein